MDYVWTLAYKRSQEESAKRINFEVARHLRTSANRRHTLRFDDGAEGCLNTNLPMSFPSTLRASGTIW